MSSLKHIFRVRGEVRSVDDSGNSEAVVPISFESVAELEDGTDAGQVDRIVAFPPLTLQHVQSVTGGFLDIESPGDIGFGNNKDALGNSTALDAGSVLGVGGERNLAPVGFAFIANVGEYDCEALVDDEVWNRGAEILPGIFDVESARGDFFGSIGGTKGINLHAGGAVAMSQVVARSVDAEGGGSITLDGFWGRYLAFSDSAGTAAERDGTTIEVILGARSE